MARAVRMASQGVWMKWESAVPRKITWKTLWKMEPIRIQFTIRSTYDLLPTPTNLMRWGKIDDPKCGLCSEPGHLEHILSSCKTALTQRRFTWRHDMVLRKLAHHLVFGTDSMALFYLIMKTSIDIGLQMTILRAQLKFLTHFFK